MATRRTAKKAKHATRRGPKHEANLGQKEARLVMAAESQGCPQSPQQRRIEVDW
jgi:hypothetical protein